MLPAKQNPLTDVYIELGGGDRPQVYPRCLGGPDINVDVRTCFTAEGKQTVDFTVDFEEFPWPIGDNEFTCVFSHFCLEHISYPLVPQFLAECYRITKPGGQCIIATANTEAQLRWIAEHPEGWDNKNAFTSCSEVLFGSQDYRENTHRAYFSPAILLRLFEQAGFTLVVAQPYGARGTDIVVRGTKPANIIRLDSPVKASGDIASGQSIPHVVSGTEPATFGTTLRKPTAEEVKSMDWYKHHQQELAKARAENAPGAVYLATPEALQPILGFGLGSGCLGTIKQVEGLKVDQSTLDDFVDPTDEVAKSLATMADIPSGSGTLTTISLTDKQSPKPDDNSLPREALFDKAYFNGGHKVGGYALGPGGAYRDFECHWHTFNHIMARRPESVLEVGCARGYILKRLQDVGIRAEGLEISKHCIMTRAAEGIRQWDLCRTISIDTPGAGDSGGLWPWASNVYSPVDSAVNYIHPFDLCFSIATLEHVPEEYLPAVIKEMARTCKRGLHGVDFGEHDDGFDKTHCTLKSRQWWLDRFAEHAPGWPVEIFDKEELERGVVPQEVLTGDGKLKLEIGSFTTMTPWGWITVDIHDLTGWAAPLNYRYLRHDVRTGLPFETGTVDLIHANHFLEHLSYKEGLNFLRECRRVLKPETGALRLAVPDAHMLAASYLGLREFGLEWGEFGLAHFDEISDGAADCPTPAGKLWELLFSGHQAAYDEETLRYYLREAGFLPLPTQFRESGDPGHDGLRQIRRECTDTHPCLSLYMDAVPMLG